MTLLHEISGLLAFRTRSLQSLAQRRHLLWSFLYLSAGFLAYALMRNYVYAGLPELRPPGAPPGILDALFQVNLIQTVLFLSVVYIPSLIALSNAFTGDGLGLSVSREEYRTHVSALFPLWGTLFLLSAPLQWIFPQFLVLGIFGIGIGLLILIVSMMTYTVWAVRELNYISTAAAFGVFVVSWFTLPIFFVLSRFLLALPFFILIPVLYILFQRFRGAASGRIAEREFSRHLRSLTANPQDADAHYQLGLLHFNRGSLDAARSYFEHALEIDPDYPDYHYYMGRVFESKEKWPEALAEYEKTYRLEPEYGQGDIFREVGKGYLKTGQTGKAAEFLKYFLQNRTSDPEGRYWLAEALGESGDREGMRIQLNILLEQARTSPRFFRKEHRQWIYRARKRLRELGSR